MSRTFYHYGEAHHQPELRQDGVWMTSRYQKWDGQQWRVRPLNDFHLRAESGTGLLSPSSWDTTVTELWVEYRVPLSEENLTALAVLATQEEDFVLATWCQERLNEQHLRRGVTALARLLRENPAVSGDNPLYRVPTWRGAPFAPACAMQAYSPYRLYSTQLVGAWALSQVKHLGLFFDMRVGKTATALTAARWALTHQKVDVVVVLAPISNLYDPWEREVAKFFPGLTVNVVAGTVAEDAEAIDAMWEYPGVLILSYDRAHRRPALLELFKGRRVFLIADETSKIKNAESSRGSYLDELALHAEYSTAMNGTPIGQGLQDAYTQLRLCDPWMLECGTASWSTYEKTWLEKQGGKYFPVHPVLLKTAISHVSLRWIRSESDQYWGESKSKSFVYQRLLPSTEQRTEAKLIADGFIREMENLENSEDRGAMRSASACALAMMTHLRQVAAGHTKFFNANTELDHREYIAVPFKVDPKMLYVQAYLLANPELPLIISCEFVAQDQQLKRLLDRMDISWASTSPRAQVVQRQSLPEKVTVVQWRALQAWFKEHGGVPLDWDPLEGLDGWASDTRIIYLPDFIRVRSQDALYSWARRQGWAVSFREFFAPVEPYPSRERAAEFERYNQGEARVFILRAAQGMGFSLARVPCLARGEAEPEMFVLSPPWSPVDFEQLTDRAIAHHPLLNRSTRTLVHVLYTSPSIEGRIIEALKKKKEVQQVFLDDLGRLGYTSFVTSLLEHQGEEFDENLDFDVEEMAARIELLLSPERKLTEKLFAKLAKERPDEAGREAISVLRAKASLSLPAQGSLL